MSVELLAQYCFHVSYDEMCRITNKPEYMQLVSAIRQADMHATENVKKRNV